MEVVLRFHLIALITLMEKKTACRAKDVNIHVRMMRAQPGWSGSRVKKLRRSVTTSAVGKPALKKRNHRRGHILKVKRVQ